MTYNYNPDQHHRRSVRLSGYDYTQPGAYFVTIVTQGRECLFGDVLDGEVRLNRAGQVAQREWERLPRRFPRVQLDAFVVMPNHIHGIIIINHAGRGTADCTDAMAAGGPAVPLPPNHSPAGRGAMGDDTAAWAGTADCTDAIAAGGPALPLPPNRSAGGGGAMGDDTAAWVGTADCTDGVAAGGPAVPLPPNHSPAGRGAMGDDTAAWVDTADCTDAMAAGGPAVPLPPNHSPAGRGAMGDDTAAWVDTADCTDGVAAGGPAVPLPPNHSPAGRGAMGDDTAAWAGTADCADAIAAGGPALPLPPNRSAGGGGTTGDDTAAWVGTADCSDAMAAGGPAVPLLEPTTASPREQFGRPVPGSIPTMVRSYKSAATLRINLVRGTPGASVWQRNYYEHVVRNEASLNRIREYIADNPARWDDDDENREGARR